MRRGVKWAAAASVVLVGIMFVAGFPLHTYLQQRSALLTAEHQRHQLANESRSLSGQISKLNTDSEVERLARQYYGMVKPGEQAYTILPPFPSVSAAAPPRKTSHPKPLPPQGFWARVGSQFAF